MLDVYTNCYRSSFNTTSINQPQAASDRPITLLVGVLALLHAAYSAAECTFTGY